jgi:hypothetical protein
MERYIGYRWKINNAFFNKAWREEVSLITTSAKFAEKIDEGECISFQFLS